MLGIDEGGHSALFLRLTNHLQRDGGLAGRLRAEDLDHTAAREAADTERRVERDGAGGDHGDGNHGSLAAQLHDGALAKLLFDLRQSQVDRPAFFSFLVRHECCSLAPSRPLGAVRTGKSKLQWVSVRQAPFGADYTLTSRAVGGSEWAIRGEERLNTDGLLYIQLSSKSEEIAKYTGTKVHVLSCLTLACDAGYGCRVSLAFGAIFAERHSLAVPSRILTLQ